MEEMYFNIGARIRFRDGAGGTIHKVVIDPHSRQVTDLVIVKGFLQRHDYVIPVSAVEQVSEDEIQVALYLQELASYPEYREVEFEEWLDDWEHDMFYPREHTLVWNPMVGFYQAQRAIIPLSRYRLPKGIPFGEEVIGRSSVVCNIEGVVGKIDHLWLDRGSWEIAYLVVRRGLIPHYIVIPFSWISSITPEKILIRGVDSQLKEVPMTLLQVGPTLVDGGEIGSEGKPLDENLTIAEEVEAALSEDPRTVTAVIEVIYERGVITLTGEVENESAHLAAEEIAHRHEGVVSVVNALEVRPKRDAAGSMATIFEQLIKHDGATTVVKHVPTIY